MNSLTHVLSYYCSSDVTNHIQHSRNIVADAMAKKNEEHYQYHKNKTIVHRKNKTKKIRGETRTSLTHGISMYQTDYRKSYSFVTHTMILKSLQFTDIPPCLTQVLMSWWVNSISDVLAEAGFDLYIFLLDIFEGDSVSSLLFCLRINLLRSLFNRKDGHLRTYFKH